MEISPTLATESFSFSWLTNHSCSFEDETKRFLDDSSSDFSFGIVATTSATIADEIFRDGCIVPKDFIVSKSAPSTPLKFIRPCNTQNIHHRNLFREWKRSSKRIMEKLLGFLRPRKSIRVDDFENSTHHMPMRFNSYPTHVSYELDMSISDAVLHCKRSNGI